MEISLVGVQPNAEVHHATQVEAAFYSPDKDWEDMPIDPTSLPNPDSFFFDNLAQGNDTFAEMSDNLANNLIEYAHSDYTIVGDNVVTEGDSYDYNYGNNNLHVEFERAVDQTNDNETWTMQFTHNGVNMGTSISVITDAGADIYYVDADGNKEFQGHLAPGSIKP